MFCKVRLPGWRGNSVVAETQMLGKAGAIDHFLLWSFVYNETDGARVGSLTPDPYL